MLSREVVWKNKGFEELKYLVVKGDRVKFFQLHLFYFIFTNPK